MLSVQPQEISKKKQIGHLDESPVYQLDLKGGLYVIIKAKEGGSVELLGSGAHHLVAKAVAKKIHPRLVITELMKSEGIEPSHFERLVPYYVNMTNELNKRLNG